MGRLFRVALIVSMLALLSSMAISDEAVSGQGGNVDKVPAETVGIAPLVVQITVDGPITPVSADYIEKQIAAAAEEGAGLVVLNLDTPGGLVTSTRQIVKAFFAAEVPVAVHVAPPGARAASAGVFITMAAHVAAMAPGTNIGAAHPVSVGGGNPFSPGKDQGEKQGEGRREKEIEPEGESGQEGEGEKKAEGESGREGEGEKQPAAGGEDIMEQKVLNDTVAFVRSIAERMGRNADWAERAVRESVSVTEKEALELNVIDLVAEDLDELLEAVEGRVVTVSGEEITLSLARARIVQRPMSWRHRILASLSDPNIAYILMMLGIYGLFFELANPGVILPGVLGGICLILAFFSFQVIPINYAGLLLILVAVILFILEIKVVSYGMLSVGGVASLFLGSIMMFDTAEPYYRLSLYLVVSVTVLTALFFVLGLGLAIRAQRRRPVTGVEGLLGETGIVTVDLGPEGRVRVHGEIWTASSVNSIPVGARVRVTAVEGMRLEVEEVQESGVRSQPFDKAQGPEPVEGEPGGNLDPDTDSDTDPDPEENQGGP